MSGTPLTWHHGLVARVWAETITDGGDHADCFRQVIDAAGQPVLDAGCGSGRLLVPWLRDGVDVDGCDLSADMIAQCRRRAEDSGLHANLYVRALHEMDLPRCYRTIVMCGAIGLGGDRRRDQEALHRCARHLEPGGVLALDSDVPWASEEGWKRWRAEGQRSLPEAWPPPVEPQDRGTFADGSRYEMCARTVAFDPLTQVARLEMRVRHYIDGEPTGEEVYPLVTRSYFRDELVHMLEEAGFVSIEVFGDYRDEPATSRNDVHVFIARKAR